MRWRRAQLIALALPLGLTLIMLPGCNTPRKAKTARATNIARSVAPPTSANQAALKIIDELCAPLPKKRLLNCTRFDPAVYEYLFTELMGEELTALNIVPIFASQRNAQPTWLDTLPEPDYFAMGRLRDGSDSATVLLGMVQGRGPHYVSMAVARYDDRGHLIEHLPLGQLDFISSGNSRRRYWLVFSESAIEFAAGEGPGRRISVPCRRIEPVAGGLRTSTGECSRYE